jgi:hypothetical protein
VVGQATLLVAFLTGEPVSLAGVAAEAGLAIGGELLAVGQRAGLVDDGDAAAESVGEVEGHGGAAVIRVGAADPNQRDAVVVVEYVQMFFVCLWLAV